VQEYIDGFRKMALMLDIPLQTQETLMKYIGGLPTHIRNTIFMFGPTNLDKVYVQAMYIDVGKEGVSGESLSSRKEDKRKRHGKNANAMNKEGRKALFDPGGYRWPPTFSNWPKTCFWQFW
jgi:hypothetical protein